MSHGDIVICLIVCLLGGLIYFALTEPKKSALATLGLWSFGCGLVVTLYFMGLHAVHW